MSIRKAILWSYGAQLFIFAQTFGTSVIVARLLGPYETGIFAVGAATTGALATLANFGIAPYLIRHESLDASVKSTVFTVNALINALVSAIVFGIAAAGPLLGMNDRVRLVLFILAFTPLLQVFEFMPSTLIQREMNFRLLSMVSMGRAVVNSCILLVLAFLGLGALSYAFAVLGSAIFSAILFNVVGRRHAVFTWGVAGWRELTKFGLQMLSIGGLATLVQRTSELILSRFLGIAALGVYTRASSLSNQIWDNIYGLGARVIFSQMAEEMRTAGTIRRTFLHGLAMLTALIWPLLVGLAVLSGPFIHLLYGERWSEAALPLAVLLMTQVCVLGFGMNWHLCVLRKQTAWQARNEGIRAVVGLLAFTIGATVSVGAAAFGRACEALTGVALFGPRMRQLAGTERGEMRRVYLQSGFVTVLAVVPAALLMLYRHAAPTTSWLEIGGAIVLGIVSWAGGLIALRHPLYHEGLRIVSRLTGRGGDTPAGQDRSRA